MLSICIPAYNYARYLPEAIESALKQPDDFELIVLDNASSDGTPALRERYESDPRVTWVRNEQTLPVQQNWNKAVSLASRPWVKLLQADDRLAERSIQRLLEIVSSQPAASFHGHLSSVIDSHGNKLREQVPFTRDKRPLRLGVGDGLPLKLRQTARLKEPTSNVFRKQAWEAIGGYTSELRFTFDVAFNIELFKRYEGTLWSEYLAEVRRHAQSDGARLPAETALGDLRNLIGRIESARGGALTSADRHAGLGWMQFRALELAAQRIKSRPGASALFLVKQFALMADVRGWPTAGGLLWRRATTGDVQRQG
jgi:glycosyltransferase involved in cell wall biosynthesis